MWCLIWEKGVETSARQKISFQISFRKKCWLIHSYLVVENPHPPGVNLPMFYAPLLRTKVVRAAFLCLCFSFVLYRHKNVGAKAARRTLVKLTPERHLPMLRNYISIHQRFSEMKEGLNRFCKRSTCSTYVKTSFFCSCWFHQGFAVLKFW